MTYEYPKLTISKLNLSFYHKIFFPANGPHFRKLCHCLLRAGIWEWSPTSPRLLQPFPHPVTFCFSSFLSILKFYLLLSPLLYSSPSYHYLSSVTTPGLSSTHMAARVVLLQVHTSSSQCPSLSWVLWPFLTWPLPVSGLTLCCSPPRLRALDSWVFFSSLNVSYSLSTPSSSSI